MIRSILFPCCMLWSTSQIRIAQLLCCNVLMLKCIQNCWRDTSSCTNVMFCEESFVSTWDHSKHGATPNLVPGWAVWGELCCYKITSKHALLTLYQVEQSSVSCVAMWDQSKLLMWQPNLVLGEIRATEEWIVFVYIHRRSSLQSCCTAWY